MTEVLAAPSIVLTHLPTEIARTTLRFRDELSYEEIAAVIDRTVEAARSRVFYGLKALERELPCEVMP